MYHHRGAFNAAKARYANVDLSSRVEGASPHQLIVIMFEEALKALDAMRMAAQRNDIITYGEKQTRLLSIIYGLETSLDFEGGGEIARGLASIYREARRLVVLAGRSRETGPLDQAKHMLGEIFEAWQGIGGG